MRHNICFGIKSKSGSQSNARGLHFIYAVSNGKAVLLQPKALTTAERVVLFVPTHIYPQSA